jgi:hypothetical protein
MIETRKACRAELATQLHVQTRYWLDRDGNYQPWFIKRLAASAMWGIGKDNVRSRNLNIMRLHFIQGYSLEYLTKVCGLSLRQLQHIRKEFLDLLMEYAPMELAQEALTRWRLKACPKCGGDQSLDPEGAHGWLPNKTEPMGIKGEKRVELPEWVCLQCGCRVPA